MDKIKNFRNKTKSEGSNSLNPGILNKLTKRYSNVSNKLLRRSPGRNSNDINQPISGSYDMTGSNSDDHKLEIGAPILISKTTLDSDYLESIVQIKRRSSTTSADSDDNEVFVDAKSSSSINPIGEIQFQFFPNIKDVERTIKDNDAEVDGNIIDESDKLPINDTYDIPLPSKEIPNTSTLKRHHHSKSTNNICKTELQVFLEKTPSLECVNNKQLNAKTTECSYDFPKHITRKNTNSLDKDNNVYIADKTDNIHSNKSEKDTKCNVIIPTDIQMAKDTIANDLFLSIEKLNRTSQYVNETNENDILPIDDGVETTRDYQLNDSKRSGSNTPIIYNSNCSLNHSLNNNNNDIRYLSKESFKSDDISLKDFDMKSVSFESLNAKDDEFLSVEELDWLKEEFNRSIDLEYCDHRDNLKPNERRITLLRNKNNKRFVNINEKKEKLTNAWSGIKNWIGEEKGKFKEVVTRHAALQRVGGIDGNGKQTMVKNQAFFDKIRKQNRKKYTKSTESDDEQQLQSTASGHTNNYSLSQRTSIYSTVKVNNTNENTENNKTDNISIINNDDKSKIETDNISRKTISETGASHITKSTKCEQISDERNNFVPFLKRNKVKEHIEGQNGFEELRRYVKQGGDFGKELVCILQERIEAEQLYSKSLSKMASKLNKACREIPGSIAEAWRNVATEMETRGDVHRQFSNSLNDDIVKPLKNILDNHHKTRKSIESAVDKSSRILSEWRVSEGKSKKNSHTAARENEKLQDAMLDVRITRSPSIALLHHGQGHNKSPEKDIKSTEKDCAKLDNKRRKAEESVKRADVEYYTLCIRSERARVDWEMAVLRGSTVLQTLENQRLTNLKDYVSSYLKLSTNMNPVIVNIVDRLTTTVNACNTQKDLIIIRNIRRASEGPSEQLLPDFYCEHTTLAMNRERRKQALVKLLQLVRQDLERERRSRNGLKGLTQTLTDQDCQNITDKLYHIRSMLTYLEGARYKLQSALFELDHKPRGQHPLAPHIQITRDRTGLQQSILKVPLWLKNNEEDDNDDESNSHISSPTTKEDIEDLDCIDTISQSPKLSNNCVDIKNEVLIKKFDNNSFTRSKSSMEFSNKNDDIKLLNHNVIKSNTLSDNSNDSLMWDRGIADGVSNQPDSDFDEFSSQDEDDESSISKKDTNNIINTSPIVIGRCRALYNYTPKLYDELELKPGDIIEVHAKQEDGWWLGATKNHIGIFPATYAEEII